MSDERGRRVPIKAKHRLSAIFVVVAALTVLPAPLPANADSAVDEYTLDIPNAGGDTKFDVSAASASSDANHASPSYLPPAVVRELNDAPAGAALAQITEDPAFGAPPSEREMGIATPKNSKLEGSLGTEARSQSPQQGLLSAVANVGTDPAGGALVGAVVFIAFGLGWVAVRRATHRS